jgi:hypothetical protein
MVDANDGGEPQTCWWVAGSDLIRQPFNVLQGEMYCPPTHLRGGVSPNKPPSFFVLHLFKWYADVAKIDTGYVLLVLCGSLHTWQTISFFFFFFFNEICTKWAKQ